MEIMGIFNSSALHIYVYVYICVYVYIYFNTLGLVCDFLWSNVLTTPKI